MKPVEPRLLRVSARAVRYMGLVVISGILSAGTVIAIAVVLSGILARAVAGDISLREAVPGLTLVAGLAVGRGALTWLGEFFGHQAGASVISALRVRLVRAAAQHYQSSPQGPAGSGSNSSQKGDTDAAAHHAGALTTAATTGLDSLDTYFARYVPQLVLGAAIPVMVLAFLMSSDVLSGLILLITLPVIPLFMWLIGAAARTRIEGRWTLLQRLGGYFLDVIQGLPTLRIFGRADDQVERIRAVTEASRRATMGTLSIAFLSSLVLESLSSLATALVAAEIGVRLVDGTLTLPTGLAVLIVVPEAFMPLRQLGSFFHASMEGLTAATTVMNFTQGATGNMPPNDSASVGAPVAACLPTHVSVPDPRTISLVDITCGYEDRGLIFNPLTFEVTPATTNLLAGPSGVGKSTLLSVLLRFHEPLSGRIRVGGTPLGRDRPQRVENHFGVVAPASLSFSRHGSRQPPAGCSRCR